MYGVNHSKIIALLVIFVVQGVLILGFVHYLDQRETVRLVPERMTTYHPPGDGMSRSVLELRSSLQKKLIERDKLLKEIERETERFQQRAFLLSIEPVESTEVEHPTEIWINAEQLQQYLNQSNWPPELHPKFINVMSCESGEYNPATDNYDYLVNAKSDQGRAWGLGQVRIDYHPSKVLKYNLLEALPNLNASYDIYLEAGGSFWPWSCSPDYVGAKDKG